MMRVVVVLSLVLCVSFVLPEMTGQIEEDAMLKKLMAALPEGWKMEINGDTLKIEHPDPIWELKSNYINAPMDAYEDSEENGVKILTNGEKIKAHFYFILKPKKGLSKSDSEKANYFSQRYALFHASAAGFDTPYARYYPWHLENEATLFYNVTLRDNLKVGLGPVYPEVNYERP